MIVLEPTLKNKSTLPKTFESFMALRGDVYRHEQGRRTQKIFLNGEPCFIKQHTGVGWKEIFKNLCQCRWPVLSAKEEWKALQRLQTLSIPVPQWLAYGCRGFNPARLKSFIMTRALPASVSLEDLCRDWPTTPPSFAFKKRLIENIATLARTLHQNGINHRDFYLCHFLWDHQDKKIYIIDWHRAQLRRQVPLRWIIKDLAGLYFSSIDIGLTMRDRFRFMKIYAQSPLRSILNNTTFFWQKVKNRGDKLHRDLTSLD